MNTIRITKKNYFYRLKSTYILHKKIKSKKYTNYLKQDAIKACEPQVFV